MHRITVWGINYHPELVGIGVYNTDLCNFMNESGYDVTMVTAFAYYPNWRQLPCDRLTPYRLDINADGCDSSVKVQRCWLYVPKNPTAAKRILHEVSFALTSFFKVLTLPRSDLYFVVMPPLLLGVLAWIVSFVKNAPVFLHVQDLQPDAAISLGMLKEGPFIRCLLALEKFAYDKAAAVSSISKEMCKTIEEKGVSSDKIRLLPNWVKSYPSFSLPQLGSWKMKHQIDLNTAIVSYAGSLGTKQGLELIIEVAKLLENKSSLVFVIAGNGGAESALKRLKSAYRLNNVIFEDVLSEEEHTSLILDSDVCLIPQRKGSSLPFLPSKLLKILALGRPVITNAEQGSALHNAVMQGKFGEATSPGEVQAMAKAIVDLWHNPEKEKYMVQPASNM